MLNKAILYLKLPKIGPIIVRKQKNNVVNIDTVRFNNYNKHKIESSNRAK